MDLNQEKRAWKVTNRVWNGAGGYVCRRSYQSRHAGNRSRLPVCSSDRAVNCRGYRVGLDGLQIKLAICHIEELKMSASEYPEYVLKWLAILRAFLACVALKSDLCQFTSPTLEVHR